jgi:cell division protein FtsZ
VDTLLVISNDKLRHQFGNLKMKEAFAKADNVLATAAKCITDVINSTGQINVDFADVCTVMRSGGVAILGSAQSEGENRAQRAIEEALNSPLLNDNDIRGAKWILININSAEGDHEFTMDEVEIIQTHLLGQCGENTDIILGLGYDNALGAQLGITLIATGFEYKDPFSRKDSAPAHTTKDQKIVMTLDMSDKEPAMNRPVATSPAAKEQPQVASSNPGHDQRIKHHEAHPAPSPLVLFTYDQPSNSTVNNLVEKMESADKNEWIHSQDSESSQKLKEKNTETNSPVTAVSGGYLARPANIYDEEQKAEKESIPEHIPVKDQILGTIAVNPLKEEAPSSEMQLVFKDEIPAADEPRAHPTHHLITPDNQVEDPAMQDEAEELKRRAADRINKLRNLSFNINAADPNNEFETVPAYIRRNLELYNTISNVENFYSNYEVKTDEQNKSHISTINTFLDGKKPD